MDKGDKALQEINTHERECALRYERIEERLKDGSKRFDSLDEKIDRFGNRLWWIIGLIGKHFDATIFRRVDMSDEGIRVPTWALPAFLAVLSGAVVWGASEARAQATQEEVDRIEAVVEKTVAEAQATGKLDSQCDKNRGYRRFLGGTGRDSESVRREAPATDRNNAEESELKYDPANPNLYCDLREWRMLELVNPPQYRHCIAKEWMRYNYRQCEYGGMIYVQSHHVSCSRHRTPA